MKSFIFFQAFMAVMNKLQSVLDSASAVCACWDESKPLSLNILVFKKNIKGLREQIRKFIDSAAVSERITFHRDAFILRQKTVFLIQHFDELLSGILLRIPLLEIQARQCFVTVVDNTVHDFMTKIFNYKKQISAFVEKQKPKSAETRTNKFFRSMTNFFFPGYTGWEL